jgi:hypothetical protein
VSVDRFDMGTPRAVPTVPRVTSARQIELLDVIAFRVATELDKMRFGDIALDAVRRGIAQAVADNAIVITVEPGFGS